MNKKVLGVIGGMGTAATIDFYTRIMNHTVAHKDQEHIDMVIINHASIIDRTYAIKNNKLDELLKQMHENLKILKKDYDWLKKQVEKFGIKPEEALLVTIDGKGNFFCQEKMKKK